MLAARVRRISPPRALPRPLIIPTVMTLKTLADVRTLMRHLPAEHRERPTWRHVRSGIQCPPLIDLDRNVDECR